MAHHEKRWHTGSIDISNPPWALRTMGLVALLMLLVGALGACGSSAEATEEVFTDPGGAYRMLVPPKWEPTTAGVPPGVEGWYVDLPRNGFAANVNVMDSAGVGMDLEEYMSMSVENAHEQVDGFVLLSQDRFNNPSGDELAVMEYRLDDLRALGVVGIRDDHVVVATFVSREEDFYGLRPEVEPYLRTLELLDPSAAVG